MALAQAGSSIAGGVTDNTGGVLPGVTVEASSPALIEGSRVAFTDGQGRYSITDLRPGPYSLTFTLPGFSTIIRDQLDLAGNFAMTIDIEMRIGAIEESVTVSGESPVVDVQQTTRSQALDRELLDSIPTGRHIQSTGQLIPGIKLNRPEVGLSTATQQTYMTAHGMSRGQTTVQVDGMMVNGTELNGAVQNYHNHLMSEEMVYETSGVSAETSGGGVRLNMIPREGGNTFSGQLFLGGSWSDLQTDNLTAEQESFGLRSSESIDRIYDINIAQGGKLIQDKLWFYGSFRRWVVDKPIADSFARNANGTVPAVFDPDPAKDTSLPGVDDNTIKSGLLRLTWQIDQKNKFGAYLDRIFKERFHEHSSTEDVATASTHWGSPLYTTFSGKYTSTVSNRLLIEAGFSGNTENWTIAYQDAAPPFGPDKVLRQARPSNFVPCFETPCFHGDPNQFGNIDPWYTVVQRISRSTSFQDTVEDLELFSYPERTQIAASASYVTGSHNLKIGTQIAQSSFNRTWSANGDLRTEWQDGAPDSVFVRNRTVTRLPKLDYDWGVYAQDTWTLDQLTVNAGIRFEWMKGSNEANTRSLGRFTPAFAFPAQEGLPDWFDISPRVGIAYDLFGDATTAVKFSWGRYNLGNTTDYQSLFSPITDRNDRRDWFDCHLAAAGRSCSGNDPWGTNDDGFAQDWEIGSDFTQNFGLAASVPVQDPNVQRPFTRNMTLGVQRELLPGLSTTFTWYHRTMHDMLLNDNRARRLSDWTRYEIANPCAATGAAPSGFPCTTNGTTIPATLPIYNLNADKIGLSDRIVTNVASDSDLFSDIYNGFEFGWNARLAGGASVFGGYTIERVVGVSCYDPNDPNRLLFCDGRDQSIPFLHEFKLSGSVPLKYGIQVSGSWQSYPGQEVDSANSGFGAVGGDGQIGLFPTLDRAGNITYNVPRSAFPTTRNSSVAIPLMPNGAAFYDRLNQVDVSIAKWFDLPNGMRWQMQADIYNLGNLGPTINGSNTWSSTLGRATQTMQGRFLQLTTQLRW